MRTNHLSGPQQFLLVVVRFAVGWHLFYQGFGKLQAAHWSSEGYLRAATGPLASLFHKLAGWSSMLAFADRATVWGLIVFGLLLMLGLLTRVASLGALALLALFYLAHPTLPVHGFAPASPDGYELYVNRVVIEALALAVAFAFDTGKISGLDLLVHQRLERRRDARGEGAAVAAAVRES